MSSGKGRMTDAQRMEALLNHQKPDRVPLWPFLYFGFAGVNTGYSIAEMYNNPQKSMEAERRTAEQYGWVFSPYLGYASYGGWEFGGEIKWPSGEFQQAPRASRYPVETEDDVWNLKLPDVKTSGFNPIRMEYAKLAAKEKLDNEPFNISVPIGEPFFIAANISSVDKLCRWILKKPEVAHRLLRLATDHVLEVAQYWLETFGAEGVLARGSDPTSSNAVISPKQFEEFAFPYFKEVHEKVLAMGYRHIYIHVCGEQNLNLSYWAQLPWGDPGIISIGHEVELETAAKYFPNDIILGNIEPALIQTSTPEQVYQLTKEVIEKGKKCPGGFILSPGCELPPMAPRENVRMMTQAVNDFGWYE